MEKLTVVEYTDEYGEWKFFGVTKKDPENATRIWLEEMNYISDEVPLPPKEEGEVGGEIYYEGLVRAYRVELLYE